MATSKDDTKNKLHEQRQNYESAISNDAPLKPTSIAETIPEALTVADQAIAAQKKMEEAVVNRECKSPASYISGDTYSIPTPYGKVKSYSIYGFDEDISFYEDLADSEIDSDKIGKKYLKKNNIETKDERLPIQITEYYASVAIATCIEREKTWMSNNEYKEAHQISQKRLSSALKTLNDKGFIVDPKTGELEYKNPNLQRALLAQQQSR